MRVIIGDQDVIFDDEKGYQLHISTDQLLEMMRILNTVITPEGRFFFLNLEFDV